MLVRPVALALAVLFAAPVWAQADGPPEGDDAMDAEAVVEAVPAMDPALVGRWSLAAVDAPGAMGRFGASLASMACVFGADGQSTVHVVMEQDGERYDREHTFGAAAAAGAITSAGQPVGTYEPLDADRVRLTFTDGMVVQLQRTR